MEIPNQIVFYDGDCGLCNRSVAFVLKHEKEKVIHFAAIQSDFTKRLFEEKGWMTPDLSTVYFLDEGELFEKSTAALKIGKFLKAPKSWVIVFFIVPKFIRDAVYNFIAKRRKRISKGFCVMPAPGDRERFLS